MLPVHRRDVSESPVFLLHFRTQSSRVDADTRTRLLYLDSQQSKYLFHDYFIAPRSKIETEQKL